MLQRQIVKALGKQQKDLQYRRCIKKYAIRVFIHSLDFSYLSMSQYTGLYPYHGGIQVVVIA
jgi:hypothetical protein